MNRKDFLRGAGLAGLGMALPKHHFTSRVRSPIAPADDCVLIPSETAGPFPLDLTSNQFFFRQDVREDEEGVQLNLRMKIIGQSNCAPLQNVRVNIWHCNKDGLYSGYDGLNNPGQEGLTYMRGYQITDANGEVEFITIIPGWYTGRICHIHFQVYVNSTYAAISQLTFPIEPKNSAYNLFPDLYTKGEDPLDFSQDGIFADGHQYQLATLVPDPGSDFYNSFLEVTVEGEGTTSAGYIERETSKVFELGQNYPNPYRESTTVPFTLKQSSAVRLELWDLSGKLVATVMEEKLAPGNYNIDIHPGKLGLPAATYVYQLEAKNESGVFRYPKLMTYVN